MSSNSCTETSGRYGQSSRNQEDMALQPAQSQQTAARPSSAPTASGSALPAASSRAPAASVPQSPIRRNQWRPRRASRPSNQPQTAGSSSSPAQSSSATASTVPAGSSSHQPARSFSFVEAEDVLERPGITPPPTFPIRREAGLTRNVAPQGREESLREALSREPGERTARGPVSSSSKPQCQGTEYLSALESRRNSQESHRNGQTEENVLSSNQHSSPGYDAQEFASVPWVPDEPKGL